VDAHMTLHPLAEFAEVGIQLLQVVQQVACMVQQRVAGRRQLDALGLAIEQADTELALQAADALAPRRQSEVLALGGAGQAALVSDGDEQTQGDEIDTTHEEPFRIRRWRSLHHLKPRTSEPDGQSLRETRSIPWPSINCRLRGRRSCSAP